MHQEENLLVKEAVNGNMQAFEALVARYDRQVLAIAASYRHSSEDAKDIYQEVFMRVYKGLKNFEGNSAFSTWLFRITVNVCLTYKARNKRFQYASIDQSFEIEDDPAELRLSDMIEGGPSADQELMDEEIKKNINGALASLPPQQKMVFTLKHLQDMKISEIARVMNCGEGTVKKYLFTATRKMREKLKDFIE
ncbi:MAG: sigma-70 family RNA polymerase sigma factor [Ignavibacteria bacterium]|jgi:RNA polymerase sigma-70 factor (ECF subfamily)|nr:sigma-70 family RNA polymerase sigma factor [Ignavibacteria bacterium]MCU7504395.1 sigma-70 family RNA polymerase sigma factor [Ignavibacteria bacterium]MCU7518164.1 sigma-70 family RNA polymerase sigma factor [Ignavibacteria bacterium]